MRVSRWTGTLVVSALAAGGVALGAPSARATPPSSHCTPTITNLGSGPWSLPPDLQAIVDASTRLDVEPPPAGSATFDMDHDGVADGVVIQPDHTVVITRGDGVLTIPTDAVTSVMGADFDGDGHDDLVLLSPYSHDPSGPVQLVPGTTPPGTMATPAFTIGTPVQDVSGDGKPDIERVITGGWWSFQRGDEALHLSATGAGSVTDIYTTSDLDGDGQVDRVQRSYDGGPVTIHLSAANTITIPTMSDPRYPYFTGTDFVTVQSFRAADRTTYLVGYDGLETDNPPATLYRLNLTCDDPFVRAAYLDLLRLTPSDAQVADGLAQIQAQGGARVRYARSLANQPPWLWIIVTDLYHQTLGREPDNDGGEYWVGQLAGDHPKRTVAQVTGEFYASPEYYGARGGTDDGWVTALYQALLHRDPDASGSQYWVGQVRQQGRTRVAIRFFQTSESARDRVTALYQALLHRAPDPLGLDYWAGRIVTDGDLSLAANLIASPEYYQAAQARFP